MNPFRYEGTIMSHVALPPTPYMTPTSAIGLAPYGQVVREISVRVSI